MLDLSLNLGNDVQLRRTLVGLSERPTDLRVPFQVIADDLMGWEKRQFASEGAFGSGGWPALAESTKAQRVAAGYSAGPILDMTGRLRRSLTEKGAADQVLVINPRSFSFGTTVEYAEYHQEGRGVPVRKPLELPEQARKDIVKTVQRYWATGVAR